MSDSDSNSDSDSDSESFVECMIAPIPESETRQIVAGQAVSDIASTVKELVDNALDAGSKAINIKLFNQGLDKIEVSDDGCGIPTHSRPLVAMKHATSKLRTFSSLYEDTYAEGKIEKKQLGFRGEALFSMANVSQNLIIMTQTQDDMIGQELEFRHDGYLNHSAVRDVQRKVGTTVTVVKLFNSLPVRRKDLEKRIKVQRANMIRLMQAYAVLCVGVRFNVVDITGEVGSCKQEVKLHTSERSESVKETVSAVFGSKFLAGMCPIEVNLSIAVLKARASMKGASSVATNVVTKDDSWSIEGLVSRAPNALNSGKTARDIQIFSVNGRPVECPQIAKMLSSVWRNFDSSAMGGNGVGQKKRPACILCLNLPSSMFDINLAPDKREILLTEEVTICELLRDKLNNIWAEHTEGKFEANEVETQSNMSEPSSKSIVLPVENSEQVVDIEPSNLRRGKMRRRNACYIAFDNIGTKAPDLEALEEFEGIHEAARHFNALNTSFGSSENAVPESQDERLSSNRVQLETAAGPSILPFCSKVAAVKDDAKNQPQDRIPVDRKKQAWEDAKFLFNASGFNSQEDDIQQLNTLLVKDNKLAPAQGKEGSEEAAKISEISSGAGKGIVPDVLIEPPQKDPTSAEVANKSLSIQSIKQFSFQPSAEKVNAIVSPGSFADCDSPVSRSAIESKVRSTPLQDDSTACNSSPQDFARKRPRAEPVSASRAIARNQFDLETGSDTPPEQNEFDSSPLHAQTLPTGIGKKQRMEEPSEVCWDHFKGTRDVVELAQASRIEMKNTRKHLHIHSSSNSSSKGVSGSKHQESAFEIDLTSNSNTVSLSKEEFIEMTIIGQFNLGFILAMCKNNHLWILDQHACDEKYNFEKIFAETKVHEQNLIAPLPLELSPSEENCVVENMDIFEQNGFRFHFDGDKPVRHRLSLTALPHSGSGGDGRKAVQFGKEDVGALCAILGADGASSSSGYIAGSGTGADGGGSMGNNAVRRYAGTGGTVIRLPKAVAMFASRACRSSIMIGDSLSKKEMKQIVHRLNNLDQPWDCPHGRPTIRHVKNMIENIVHDEDLAEKRVTGPSLAVMDLD